MLKLVVKLNGTNVNPFLKMGLTQNPFPQLGMAEYDAVENVLNNLGAVPIKDEQDIRDRLKGFGHELVDLCVQQYKPGEMVSFEIEFRA